MTLPDPYEAEFVKWLDQEQGHVVECHFQVLAWLPLLGAMQLALRHPEFGTSNANKTADIVRLVGQRVVAQLITKAGMSIALARSLFPEFPPTA